MRYFIGNMRWFGLFCLFSSHIAFAAPLEPIKIAAIYAHTGVAALDNEDSWLGVRLAVDTVNNNGGVLGRDIQLLEFDNQSSALGTVKAAQQAIAQGVVGVIGSAWSAHSLAMAPMLDRAGVPMISSLSTTPSLTQNKPYIFRVCFTDNFQGIVMAEFARQRLHKQRAVTLTIIDNKFSTGLAYYFSQAFKQFGGEVVWQGEYTENAIDFSSIVRKLKTLKPDVVFIPGYLRDSGLLIKQAVQHGIDTQFLGGDGWDIGMVLYGDEFVYGNYYASHWHTAMADSDSRYFKQLFSQQYPDHPNITSGSALAFDAVKVLVDAIRRSNSLQRADVRDALADTHNFNGVTGQISFDQDGNPLSKQAIILQLSPPEPKFVTRILPDISPQALQIPVSSAQP